MKFAQTHKIFAYFLALVSVTPLLFSGEVGWIWTVIFPLMAIVGWFLEPPLTTNRRYRRIITASVFIVLAAQILRFLAGAPMAMMGMEFAIALLGIKLLSRGHASDYQQITILSFLQVIAGTVAMDDLLFAWIFLIFVAICPPVLALSYLRKEMEQRFGESHHTRRGEMLERLLKSKRVISPGFILGSAALSLPVLFITAVLFITFPRVGFGLFGHLSEKSETAGFGDKVTLGDLDILQQDQTVLLRLQPFGFDAPPPPSLDLRFRGAVFDQYQDSTWTKSRKEVWRRLPTKGSDFYLEDKFVVKTQTPGFEILLETMKPSLIFVPEGTGVITTYRTAEGGVPRTRLLGSNQYGTIYYDDKAQVGLRYKVYLTDTPPFGDPPGDQHSYLQLPEKSERLKSLATELAGDGSLEDQTRSLVARLKRDYKYSLRLSSSKANVLADTPLDRFLFTRRTGTCEHFASALTLLLRAIGVPARIATGFSGADWNPVGGYYVIPSRYAHSWTEAFVAGKWHTLDATPPATASDRSWRMNRLALLLDMMRMRWHKHVVGYDAASQFEIAMGLRRAYIRTFRTGSTEVNSSLKWFIIVGICTILALVLGLKWWRLKNRTGRPTKKNAVRTKRMREATKLYLSLEKRLARRGFVRPRDLTPTEHLRSLHDADATFANVAKEVINGYNRMRFGPQKAQSADLKRLWSLIREI